MENQELNQQQGKRFDYVPIKEAAARVGISEFVIRRIVEAGYVKTIRSGNRWLLEFNSLLDALEKGNLAI